MSSSNLSTSFGSITLKASPEQMHQAASDLGVKIRKAQALFSQLSNEIADTSEYWEGAVAERERYAFVDEKENFTSLIGNLNNYVTELDTITDNYESTETAVAEAAESLPSDILQ